jgi:hypothetical protein
VLVLAAGLARWVDGRDGSVGGEPWWAVTQLTLLGAVVALVGLVLGIRRDARHRGTVTVSLVLSTVGALGLVAAGVGDTTSWPFAAALGLFDLGVASAWAALAAAHQVSWLEPALVLAGVAVIGVSLDLLPVAAALLAGALAQSPGPAAADLSRGTAPRSASRPRPGGPRPRSRRPPGQG